MLVDPSGGVGYAFGQKLPSAHMTTIATNQPKAVDGNGGGTWAPSAPIILNGASALQLDGKLKYTTRLVTRQQTYTGLAHTLSGNWSISTSDLWRNTAVGGTLWIPLDRLAHNASFIGFAVRWQGGTGHANLPTMPTAKLYSINALTGVQTLVTTATDTSPSVPAYEAAHDITSGMAAIIVDLEHNRYKLELTGELGLNFTPNATVIGVVTTLNVTEQPEY